MYKHLKDRQYYEEIYDKSTVDDARRGMKSYDKFYVQFEKKLPKDDTIDRPGNALILNLFYMQTIGNNLIRRYKNREKRISDWMERDEQKDEVIANARLKEEPYCHHCSKKGLRITDKSLMPRGPGSFDEESDEVLFMLSCPHCKKNSAFWEDGTAWKPRPTLCTACQAEMTHSTKRTKKYLTTTYSCTNCDHSFSDKLELGDKPVVPDPDFDKDRIKYCLVDKEFRDKLFEIQIGLEQLAEFGKEMKEKEDNKHIYDAIKEIKKPKIAELIPLLSPSLEKAGYIELHLDQPEMGKDVFLGFSCLDSKSERDDYDSRRTLKKLVDAALKDTNWRLMSDGISYRLGYLSGRLRAYEREEDLMNLVTKRRLNNSDRTKNIQ